MTCKNCGHELPEHAKFCNECGTPVGSPEPPEKPEEQKAVSGSAPEQTEPQQTVGNSAAVKKKQLLPWLIVVLLLIVVGIFAMILGTSKMGKQNHVESNDKNIVEVQNKQENTTTILTTVTTTVTTTKATTTTKKTTTVATTAKPVVTTTAKPRPYVTAYAKTFRLSGYDGSNVRLYLDGNFYQAYIKINGINYDTTVFNGEYGDYVELPFNPLANSETTLSVTPYDDAGNAGDAGDTVTCAIPTEPDGTINTGGFSRDAGNQRGQINCHGGIVPGYTTDYIVNGGACSTVRQSLGDTWHITAKNSCYNYGTTWYELWDSDDGDYYGWVDGNYIDFY